MYCMTHVISMLQNHVHCSQTFVGKHHTASSDAVAGLYDTKLVKSWMKWNVLDSTMMVILRYVFWNISPQ